MSWCVWDRKERDKFESGVKGSWEAGPYLSHEQAKTAMGKLARANEDSRNRGRTKRILDLGIYEWPSRNSFVSDEEGKPLKDVRES